MRQKSMLGMPFSSTPINVQNKFPCWNSNFTIWALSAQTFYTPVKRWHTKKGDITRDEYDIKTNCSKIFKTVLTISAPGVINNSWYV